MQTKKRVAAEDFLNELYGTLAYCVLTTAALTLMELASSTAS